MVSCQDVLSFYVAVKGILCILEFLLLYTYNPIITEILMCVKKKEYYILEFSSADFKWLLSGA